MKLVPMAACPQCEEFLDGISVDQPRQYLEFALRLLRLVDDGTFTINECTCPLKDLFNPEWPADIIEHNFECVCCGRSFQLFADTYHGHAGWGLTGPPTRLAALEPSAQP